MYTVFRVTARNGSIAEVMALFKAIKSDSDLAIHRRVEATASCSVGEEGDWPLQEKGILEFLDLFADLLKSHATQWKCEFDIAIDGEDMGRRLYLSTSLGGNLLQRLAELDLAIGYTFYCRHEEDR